MATPSPLAYERTTAPVDDKYVSIYNDYSDLVAKTSDTMVCQTLTENGIEEAFDKLSPKIKGNYKRIHKVMTPGLEKIVNMLLNSGFTNVWTSRFGQSGL